ncbi:MAG: Ig-like domain-containing protein [Candidatus Cohnella colombiensis]|uniref:Ig-like domain-containing protein n=1 Tax=Candidatus Cohnella colombiensis TaxID=3121368 RepID=A0AA95JAZ9_9BACL|nr:MAG: Ig-like domain-containing protein [Cohnella sp.]
MLKRSLSTVLTFAILFSLFVVSPATANTANAASGIDYDPDHIVSSITKNTINLVWPSPDGPFDVYRSQDSVAGFTKINSVDVTDSLYGDSGLQSNTRYYYRITNIDHDVDTPLFVASALTEPDFGSNVYVFDTTTPQADIQTAATNVFNIQVKNQFGPERYALLFKKGTYNADVRVGFYTHVAGLGLSPDDVTINGGVTVDAEWWSDPKTPYNATQNFWRSVENLAITPTSGDLKYAVSQAASMRRLHVKGNLTLHDRGGWASGGYLADTKVDGTVGSGSQQQWFSRNNNWTTWNGSNWNMVFVGNKTAPLDSDWPTKPFTTVAQTPVLAEKPFLTYDDTAKQYNVFVPGLAHNYSGTSWEGKTNQQIADAGRSVSLEDFYVAKPESFDVDAVNAALSAGKNLFLTPGVYQLSKPILVNNPDTIVFGLGLATLHSNNGSVAIKVADVDGVKIAGVLFEAGSVNSPVLLEVGPKGSSANHASNPVVLYDLYFRVGGDALALADVSIEINSNNVIGDHFWVWRADHGVGAGWDSNITKNGLIVNGNDVTIYGLFVEHFHEYQTLWNGENGRMYFYQSEIPYDVPNQPGWMSSGGTVNGYAAYKVADHVKNHEAYGLGVYSFFRDAAVKLESAIEIPDTPGVKIHHATSVFLGGVVGSEITHIVNNIGTAVTTGGKNERFGDYTPRTVDTIAPVAISTIAGKVPVLPGYVNEIFTNATSKQVPVIWDSIDASQYASAGSFTVNGTVGSSTIKAVATVTVSAAPNVPVTGITVAGEGNATTITTKDGTLQMVATVAPETADNTSVTWSVVDMNGAFTDKATISATGVLAALKDGQVTVIATANDGTGVQGLATITISNQGVKVAAITVSGANGAKTIEIKGATLQMATTIQPANAVDKTVTWSVVNGTGQASINATTGVLTAQKNGTVNVIATANDGSGVKGEFTVTINGQNMVLGNGWSWVVEDPTSWSIVPQNPNQIVIRTQSGSWTDGTIKGLLLRDAGTSDFTITTKLNYGGSASYEWAGLVAYQDTKNAVIFGKQSGTNQFRFGKITNGTEVNNDFSLVVTQDIYLKIQKTNTTYEASYSDDGVTWTKFGTQVTSTINAAKVGVGGRHKGPATGKNATFTDFTLTSTVIPFWLQVSSITVSGAAGATKISTKEGTLQMNASILPAGANIQSVTWSVVNTDGTPTDKATISDTGLLTAIKDGQVKVVATANDGSGVMGNATITISGQILESGWEWVREVSGSWAIVPQNLNAIKITTSDGTWSNTANYPKGILLRDPGATDFTITTKLNYSASNNYEWAGLIVYLDDKNAITLGRQASGSPANKELRFSQVKNGTQTDKTYADSLSANASIYLKIEKAGSVYSGYFSADGSDNSWTKVTDTFDFAMSNPKVGFFTRKLNAPSARVAEFSDFKVNDVIIPFRVGVSTITVTGGSAITTPRGTLQMSAAALPANANDKSITWSVVNGTGSATISPLGLLTAVANGEVTVIATANDGSGVTGSTPITISGQPTAVASIAVKGQGDAATITTHGGTLQMSADVSPSDADDKTITWSVVNGTGSATISPSGMLTAVANGTVTVIATANDGSSVTGSTTITISGQIVLVNSVSVTGAGGATIIATKDGTLQISATVLPANATNKLVSWTVVNTDNSVTDLATINSVGLLSAVKDGTVKVVATANDGSNVTGTLTITISGQTVGSGSDDEDDNNPPIYEPGFPFEPTNDKQQRVTAPELNKLQGGRAVVNLNAGKTEAVVSVDAAKTINNPVEVKSNGVSVTIPAAVFQELAGQAQGAANDSRIVVRIEMDQSSAHTYNLDIVLINKDGTETKLSNFSEPVQLVLPFDTSMNRDLLGIYVYDEASKQWQYVGGKVDDTKNTIAANTLHFSKYAVQEYNKTFTDVSTSHWANTALKVLAAKHIITGVTETEFKPNGNTTRAEFVAMLVRALGLKATHATNQFSDVKATAWYAQDIAAAYEVGLISGVSDTKFAPSAQITREQMAILMVRAYEYVNGTKTSSGNYLAELNDEQQVSGWAKAGVNLAIDLGLMKGQSATQFAPQSYAVRAETAQAIYNLLKLMN